MPPPWIVRLLIAGLLSAMPRAAVADEDEDRPAEQLYQISPEQIETWLFGDGKTTAEARSAATRALRTKMAGLERVAVISPDQLRKLELAGRADIVAFFEESEQVRRGVPQKSLTREAVLALFRRCSELQARQNAGLHERGSLYDKLLEALLRPDDLMRAEALERFETRAKATGADEKLALRALQKWSERAAEIRTLKTSFDLIQFDAVQGIETRWQGRWLFERPGNARLDLRARSIPSNETSHRTDRLGRPYELKAGRPESWIRNEDQFLQIRSSTFETFNRPPATAEPFAAGPDDPHDERFAFPLPQTMSLQELTERFDWRVALLDTSTVRLTGTPRTDADRERVVAIAVILRTDTWMTQAVEIVDRRGSRESIFTFGETRVNFNWISEAMVDPFHPDLSGYLPARSAR